jgi:hypothetical protein
VIPMDGFEASRCHDYSVPQSPRVDETVRVRMKRSFEFMYYLFLFQPFSSTSYHHACVPTPI